MVGVSGACSPRLTVLESSRSTAVDGSSAVTLRTVPATGCGLPLHIELRGSWASGADAAGSSCEVVPGDIVRVVLCDALLNFHAWDDREYRTDALVVSDTQHLFVHHPDTLISGTAIADSFVCLRKSVLTARNPVSLPHAGGGGFSSAALNGSMIHDVFQAIILLVSGRDGSFSQRPEPLDMVSVAAVMEDVIESHVEDIYAVGRTEQDARDTLNKVVPAILDWAGAFLGPHAAANVRDRKDVRQVAIRAVRDIEESVWSPTLGLKGKLDATVEMRDVTTRADRAAGVSPRGLRTGRSLERPGSVLSSGTHPTSAPCGQTLRDETVLAPVELKTGSSKGFAGVSHHAQVVLYTLLMSDRYQRTVKQGLLSYIRVPSAHRTPGHEASLTGVAEERGALIFALRDEVVGLVMQRNKLAWFLRLDAAVEALPSMRSGTPSMCAKCFANDSCMVQHRLLEGGTASTADEFGPGAVLFNARASHLTNSHISYYKFWKKSIAAEEALACRNRTELWSMSAEARQQLGRCLASLRLDCDDAQHPGVGEAGILLPGQRRMSFRFRRQAVCQNGVNGASLTIGEYVILSVQSLNDIGDPSDQSEVTGSPIFLPSEGSAPKWPRQGKLGMNSLESPPSRREYNLAAPSIASGFVESITDNHVIVLLDRDVVHWAMARGLDARALLWRIDTEEIVASFGIAKSNIEALFTAEEEGGCTSIRRLVVDLVAPRFRTLSDAEEAQLKEVHSNLRAYGMILNREQERALRLSLEARDYLLLLGMPGTGKTATLAAIVWAAVSCGQSVLVCSHTRSAVDHVLSRLLDLDFKDFVRVGKRAETSDPRLDEYHVEAGSGLSVSALKARLESPSVVATTCLGIRHAVFATRLKFDVVVIDEASQIWQPICLGPLRFVAEKFILVGDHYQLPPLMRSANCNATGRFNSVQSKPEATVDSVHQRRDAHQVAQSLSAFRATLPAEHDAQESLFRRLCEANDVHRAQGRNVDAVVGLVKQYRMARDIMDLINSLVYGGNLACGSDAVATQMLNIKLGSLPRKSPKWLKWVMNPARHLLFLDTDGMGAAAKDGVMPNRIEHLRSAHRRFQSISDSAELARGTESGSESRARVNIGEAHVIASSIQHLVAAGVLQNQIAVLTPFRAQVSVLRGEICGGVDGDAHADICTIDQYQGKDKDVVFVSFVRSSVCLSEGTCDGQVGPLLRDWRRVNVAITRARAKLVLVGSARTLRNGSHFLGSMMTQLESTGSIVVVDKVPETASSDNRRQ